MKGSFFLLIAIIFLSSADSSLARTWGKSNNSLDRSVQILVDGYEYNDEDSSERGQRGQIRQSSGSTGLKGGAGIQFMITNKMRGVLEEDLNYLSEEIDVMDPQIAAVVIDRGLSRPSTGMPTSWIKTKQIEPVTPKYIKYLQKKIKALSNFAVKKVLPIAIPVVAAAYILPRAFQFLVETFSSESFKSPSKLIKNKKSRDIKKPKEDKIIDIRSLHKIIKPPVFLSKFFQRE